MTKADLIEAVQKATSAHDLSKSVVGDVVEATFAAVAQAVKDDERFSMPGFGTFTVRNRKAREGVNPQTGAKIQIAASKTIGFKPTPKLKESL